MWDRKTGKWWGPWMLFDHVRHDVCVGTPPNSTNSNGAVVVGDPKAARFWVSHTVTDLGTIPGVRAAITDATIVCSASAYNPANITHTIAPDPSGGGTERDDWEPGIALSNHSGVTRVVQYFYGTRDDPNNEYTKPYMRYTDILPWSAPVGVTTNAINGTTAWPQDASLTWDYQMLGGAYSADSFLAVWAGDARADRNNARIYAALIH